MLRMLQHGSGSNAGIDDDDGWCAAKIEAMGFNKSWFDPVTHPKTWRLELAIYVICTTLLALSVLHRFWAERFAPNDWLKVRSRSMMILCHLGAFFQLQTGGLSAVMASQLQCWFQVIAALLVIPLLVVPLVLKLIWFKTRTIYVESAQKGVKKIFAKDVEEEADDPNTVISPSARNLLAHGVSLMFSSGRLDQNDTGTEDAKLVQKLKRWKFLSSEAGMFWISLAVYLPFFILTLATFSLTDGVFLTTCRGCTIQLVHVAFMAVFGAVSIIACIIFVYQLRNSPDPFGILAEVRAALAYGGIPALVGFVLNYAASAENWGDGWSWNVIVELSLLVFSFIQGSLQVFISRKHHSSGDSPATIKAAKREISIIDIYSNLGVLFNSIVGKRILHDAFEKYLVTEFAVENLAFVDAVNDYKTGYFDRGPAGSHGFARRVVRAFVTVDATFSINVSSEQRSRIISVIEQKHSASNPPPLEVFDECLDEVRRIIELGPLVRFSQTNEFFDLIDEGAFAGTPVEPVLKGAVHIGDKGQVSVHV